MEILGVLGVFAVMAFFAFLSDVEHKGRKTSKERLALLRAESPDVHFQGEGDYYVISRCKDGQVCVDFFKGIHRRKQVVADYERFGRKVLRLGLYSNHRDLLGDLMAVAGR